MNDTNDRRGRGLQLCLEADDKVLVANVVPDPDAEPIDEPWLLDALTQAGYAGLRVEPDAILGLLAHYNAGQAIRLKLAERIDAAMDVSLSPDGLEARLNITAAQGGKPILADDVTAALVELGVTDGHLAEAIDDAVAVGQAQDVVIARGMPPEHGRDGWLESLIPEVRSRVPRVDESDHTDYRDLGEITVVHPGDPLMRRHPPDQGSAGRTLLGVRIEPNPGKDIAYAAELPGAARSSDDPDLLLATISGQPLLVHGGMRVEPVYKLSAVDTSTGHVNFDGSVVISGDVGAGMRVRTSGDIEIGGVVEMATLEAGGNIVIKGGVIGTLGHKSTEEHSIHCDGCFTAAYVQQARIEAGDSIFIDDMSMQSDLAAMRHISIGNRKRGHVIGGHLQAVQSITAKIIGAPNRTKTVCEIGVNPFMHKRQLELSKARNGFETQLLEVSKLLDFARKNPGKLKAEMLDKARETAAHLSHEIASTREEEEALGRQIELSLQARVTAKQSLHDGVEVIHGNRHYHVPGDRGPSTVMLGDNGELTLTEAGHEPAPT